MSSYVSIRDLSHWVTSAFNLPSETEAKLLFVEAVVAVGEHKIQEL